MFSRAISSGIPILATRAVFLSNALITSDSTSEETISSIATAVLPGCYPFVYSPDIDLREGTLRLLVSLAKTTVGKDLLTSTTAVEEALLERANTIIADPDYAEQEEHEQSLVKEYREALIATTAKSNAAQSASITSTGGVQSVFSTTVEEAVENQPTGPMMLLGP